jgi:hypothetical protein
MRVLLDEQLPRQLAREITGHEVSTVQQRGWAGLKNGELLRVAVDSGFEVLVTADRNLQFQQNLSQSRLGIILLIAPSKQGGHSVRRRDVLRRFTRSRNNFDKHYRLFSGCLACV